MGHCEKPCDFSPTTLVDGEHEWGWFSVRTVGTETKQHCYACNDSSCPGREYKNPLLALCYMLNCPNTSIPNSIGCEKHRPYEEN